MGSSRYASDSRHVCADYIDVEGSITEAAVAAVGVEDHGLKRGEDLAAATLLSFKFRLLTQEVDSVGGRALGTRRSG